MSQEQEDAVVGRVARERADVDKQLAIFEAELQRYKEMFALLAQRLGEVDYILFDNEQWPESVRSAGWKMSDYRFHRRTLTAKSSKRFAGSLGKRRRSVIG